MPFPGGWAALYNDENQWIQAEFEDAVRIDAIVTQGRHSNGYNQWVTSFKVTHPARRPRPSRGRPYLGLYLKFPGRPYSSRT